MDDSVTKRLLRKFIPKKEVFSALLKLIFSLIGLLLFIFPFIIWSSPLIQYPISVLGFILLLVIFSKRVTSKREINMIKVALKNIYFLFLYVLIYICIVLLMGGLMFCYKNLDILKFLTVLSFSLAGITFIGINLKDLKDFIENYIILSCLTFFLSGLFFLLRISSLIIEPQSPVDGSKILIYDFFVNVGPTFSLLGVLFLSFGLFLTTFILLKKIKLLKKPPKKETRESLWEFFGLDELWKS